MQTVQSLRPITRFSIGDRVLCLPTGDRPYEFAPRGKEPEDFAEEFAAYVREHGVTGELRGRTDGMVFVRDDARRMHEFRLDEVLVCKPAATCNGK